MAVHMIMNKRKNTPEFREDKVFTKSVCRQNKINRDFQD